MNLVEFLNMEILLMHIVNATVWSTSLIIVGWFITKFVKGLPPSVNSWIWRIILLKSVLVFFWTYSIEIKILPPIDDSFATHLPQSDSGDLPDQSSQGSTAAPSANQKSMIEEQVSGPSPFLLILFIFWCLGCIANLVLLAKKFRHVLRIRQGAEYAKSSHILESAKNAASKLGVHVPEIKESEQIATPMVVGLIRPTIMIPKALSFHGENLELILAHEMAHIRRKDSLWSFIPLLVQAIYFYNPFVWLAQREWILWHEAACDELAISEIGSSGAKFSELILSVIEESLQTKASHLSILGMAQSKKTMTRRILVMKNYRKLGKGTRRFLTATLVSSSFLIIVPWSLAERDSNDISINYPDPTDIKEFAKSVPQWANKTFIIDRTASGKFQLVKKNLKKDEAYQVFSEVLDQLGLVAVEKSTGIINILTKRRVQRNDTFQKMEKVFPSQCESESMTDFNFSDPTEIKKVVEKISKVSGADFLIDRNVSGKILIVSGSSNMTIKQACKAFVLSLNQLGLGIRKVDQMHLLQPLRVIRKYEDKRYISRNYPNGFKSDGMVSINYSSPTDIKDIVRDVQKWSGIGFLVDRNVNGKVQILSQKKKSKKEAYRIFFASLAQLGLTTVERNKIVKIVPFRTLKRSMPGRR